MKVFYLGPEGTNSNLAAQEIFTAEFDYVPLPSIEDIFQKVALSHSYYGVIPFENSYQGVINSSLNCLIDYDLKIVKELNFAISHSFCSSNKDIEDKNVLKIASHPQVLGQCNYWLSSNYPNAEKIVTTSTAEAAKMASHNANIFCIANEYAIKLFNLYSHVKDIQDSSNNSTRFLVIGKMIEERSSSNKTSIMVNIADTPGSLMKILQPFSDLAINMTRIETRPSRNNQYLHTFFIDFEGWYEDSNIQKLLNILEEISDELRIIGSYPVKS